MKRTGAVPGTDQFRQIASDAWDHVDNVLGEVVYDNLFAKRWVKDLAQLTTRSASWTGGSIRTTATALQDLPQLAKGNLSYRTAYKAGLLGSTMLAGGLLHKLLTGKTPENITDWTYPRTGRKNADGTDERLSLPTDFKDYVNYAHDPSGTLLHKQGPLINLASDEATNNSFGGIEVRNPDDPLGKQLLDSAKFAVGGYTPFFKQSTDRMADEGQGFSPLPLMGISPAPAYVTRSSALNKASEYMHGNIQLGSRTQAEADKSRARSTVAGMIRNGDTDKIEQFIKDKGLTAHDIDLIQDKLSSPALVSTVKKLKPDQAVQVYQVATPEERQMIWPIVSQKVGRFQQEDPRAAQNLMLLLSQANQP
jgi:hypothetical protein